MMGATQEQQTNFLQKIIPLAIADMKTSRILASLTIAQAILETLYERKTLTVATTHYSEIKSFALTHPGMQNASMEFDVDRLCPTYRLFIGIPGKSNAFEISKRLGLHDEVIERAQAFLKKRDVVFENVLSEAEQARRNAEDDREASYKLRIEIEKNFGIKAYDIYGLTEIIGPGVASECVEQAGMHINEDHFIAEIIDPNTGEVLPYGEKGELVFTSITKEAFPMIRYRTRDICVLNHEKCACGRTHTRMAKPMGRSDDMLIIKGVNVFPSQIEAVLLKNGYPANYQIIVTRVNNSDILDINVEMSAETFSDTIGEISAREKALVSDLKAMLGIYAKVHLLAPKSITRSEGKAVRIIDKRNLY